MVRRSVVGGAKPRARKAAVAGPAAARPVPAPAVPERPGVLIAFEGIDGSGKSTQLRLVHQWLKALGCRVVPSEWSSSELVMGATIRGKNRQLLTPTTFSLVHATDFADRYERQILPMLKGGCIVLADRYVFTSYARDGVRGCDPGWLRRLYAFARLPDLTLYFDLPLHVAIERTMAAREAPKYFDAGMDLGLSQDVQESLRLYQGRVLEEYRRMQAGLEFAVVDAARSIHEQQAEVRRRIAAFVDLSRFQTRATS
jgi:dTMP kinase